MKVTAIRSWIAFCLSFLALVLVVVNCYEYFGISKTHIDVPGWANSLPMPRAFRWYLVAACLAPAAFVPARVDESVVAVFSAAFFAPFVAVVALVAQSTSKQSLDGAVLNVLLSGLWVFLLAALVPALALVAVRITGSAVNRRIHG